MSALSPRIVVARALHAPVAIARGRTPIEVTVDGPGFVRVGDARRVVRGGRTATFLATAAAEITVSVRGLLGGDNKTLALTLVAEAPAPPSVERAGVAAPAVAHPPLRAVVSAPAPRIPGLIVTLEPETGDSR